MQHTEKYQLNLIEPSDAFSPDALNENTQKMEDVLSSAIEAHRAETALRLDALEAHHFAFGRVIGDKQASQFVPLSFTPQCILFQQETTGGVGGVMLMRNGVKHQYLTFMEGGFSITGSLNNEVIHFLAFD